MLSYRKKVTAILNYITKCNNRINIFEVSNLLYWIDLRFFHAYGRTITGFRYYKTQYGCAPVKFKDIIDASEQSGLILIHPDTDRNGNPVEQDYSCFEKGENEIIFDTVGKYINKSKSELAKVIQNSKLWKKYKVGDVLDFNDLLDTKDDTLLSATSLMYRIEQ